jgi:hypothetical protein
MDRVSADAGPAHKALRHPMPTAAADTARRNEIFTGCLLAGDGSREPALSMA